MPDPEPNKEVEEELEPDEEAEVPAEPAPVSLIGGKFKNVEDLLSAYGEAERAMHSHTTVSAQMTKQLEDWGCVVDKTTGMITPPAASVPEAEPAPASGDQPDPSTQFMDQFYVDPVGTITGLNRAIRQQQKAAESNTKREIAKVRWHPLYRRVSDNLEVELSAIDDSFLANPPQAEQIVAALFRKVIGDYVLKATPTDETDPAARIKAISALGLESPAPTPDVVRATVSGGDRDMLDVLGLSSKEQEEVIKNAKERVKREAATKEVA